MQAGFHTIDLPGKSGQDLPLILASSTKVSGVNDAAGSPFWFNGLVPNLNLNPALFARSKSTVYNGSTPRAACRRIRASPSRLRSSSPRPGS